LRWWDFSVFGITKVVCRGGRGFSRDGGAKGRMGWVGEREDGMGGRAPDFRGHTQYVRGAHAVC
jgi:hypothetical protein